MILWAIYNLFVLNTVWERDSLQIKIIVSVWSTWGIVELKTLFETWITSNDVDGVFFSSFLSKNPYGLQLLTMNTKCQNKAFYVWLVDLQNIRDNYGLETCFDQNEGIRKCLLDMKISWTKKRVLRRDWQEMT
jgi:hypothetical protein